jgi:hypothetical protein
VAKKDIQSPVNEQALLAHDLRDCEEMLEQISSCLDRESERFVSVAYLENSLRLENNIEMNCRKMCSYNVKLSCFICLSVHLSYLYLICLSLGHTVCLYLSLTVCQPPHSHTQIHE